MSTPTRSALAIAGEFPDAEVLVADILSVVEVDDTPIGDAVDTDTSGLGPPAVTVYAPPGRAAVGRYGDIETTFLYVIAVGADRDQAKAMSTDAARVLEQFRNGGTHKDVQVHRISPVTSATELPQRNTEDPRQREGGWSIQLRRHRGATVLP